jgi:hypothetical protein
MSAGEPRQFGVKVKDDYYVCHIGDSEARSFNVSTDQLQSHRVKPGSPYAEKVGALMGGLEGTSPPAGVVDDSKLIAVPDDAAAAEEPVEEIADTVGRPQRYDSVMYIPTDDLEIERQSIRQATAQAPPKPAAERAPPPPAASHEERKDLVPVPGHAPPGYHEQRGGMMPEHHAAPSHQHHAPVMGHAPAGAGHRSDLLYLPGHAPPGYHEQRGGIMPEHHQPPSHQYHAPVMGHAPPAAGHRADIAMVPGQAPPGYHEQRGGMMPEHHAAPSHRE